MRSLMSTIRILAAVTMAMTMLGSSEVKAKMGRRVKTEGVNRTPFIVAVKVNGTAPVRVAPGKMLTLSHFAMNGVEYVEAVIVRREIYDLRTRIDGWGANPGKVRHYIDSLKLGGLGFLRGTGELPKNP